MAKPNIKKIAKYLVIIGAANWGLSIFGINLVDYVSSLGASIGTIVYGAIGVSAVIVGMDEFKK